MNFKENVTVVIDGDSKPLEMAVAKSNKVLEQSQKNNERIASRGGQSSAEAFGRQFNRAQDKWMNLAEDSFRRWGGTLGGIIADVFNKFDKVDKVQQATERYERTAGRNAVNRAEGNFASNAAGNAVGSAAGSYAGSNGILKNIFQQKASSQFVQAELWFSMAAAKSAGGLKGSIADRLRGGLSYTKGMGNAAISNGIEFGKKVIGFGGTDLGGVSKFFGGSIGLGAAGGAAAIAAVVKGFERLSEIYDEISAKQKKFADNQYLIDSIEALGNTTEKTAAILKKFGDDGLATYRDLKEQQIKLGKEIASDEPWKLMSIQAKATLDGIKEEYPKLVNGFKAYWAKVITRGSEFTGVDKQLAKDIEESQKGVAEKQKLVDDQAKKKVDLAKERLKTEEERLKTEEEIAKVQKDVDEAADEAIKRQSEERLKNLQDYQKEIVDIMESLSGKIVQGNPSLSGMTPEAVLTSESKRLYESTLSPSELALQKSYGMQQLGTSSVRDTLRRSGEMGKLGSFKRQIESANVYDTNKENAKVAVALMDLLIQYKENGNALAVKQKVSR